jgi:hypothetical protein
MKKIYYLFLLSTLFTFGQSNYLVENFDYSAASLLSANGWFAHSAGTTNPIAVNSSGLSWTTTPCIGSGVGNAALVNNTGSDENKPLDGYLTTGNVYTSFLFKTNSEITTANDDVFFHLVKYSNETTPVFTSTNTGFRGRISVLPGTTSTQFKLALAFNAATAAITDVTADLETSQTYLVVLKYTFVDGADNDTVSLFVFSDGQTITTEPATPTIGPLTGTASDIGIVQGVALRQFAATQNLIVDGIYVRSEWNMVSPGTSLSTKSNELNTSNFVLYPNPVTGNQVSIKTDLEGKKNIAFYDINGRKVLENDTDSNTIDVSTLSKGFYLVQLSVNGTFQTSKIIIE